MAHDDSQNRERSDLFSTTHWKWNAPTAMMFIAGPKRLFAEESLSDSLDPSAEEIRQATAELDPVVENATINMTGHRWFPIAAAVGHTLFFVGLPAIIAALLFRRGLIMLICGVVVARPDGSPASRWRALWRSIVTWIPLPLSLLLMVFLTPLAGPMMACIISAVFLLSLIVGSLWLPERSLQDRIAGTCLLPQS